MKRLLLALALPHENADDRLGAHGHELLYTGVGTGGHLTGCARMLKERCFSATTPATDSSAAASPASPGCPSAP